MPGAAGGHVAGLIAGGVSEGHLDGSRWEGGVALWFYEVALKEDETNVVHAQLTHVVQVLMCMAGTVEAPDCGGLTCTHSWLTPWLTPCPHLPPCPHPTAHGYARCPSLPETRTGHAWAGKPVGEWAHEQVGTWVGGR